MPSAQAVSLGLIVTELLLNAAKHGHSRPDARVEVRGQATADSLLLTVRDYGRGIPAGFDISAGAGLGMRIVANLVAQVGGSLEFEDAEPGTLCTIRVPLERLRGSRDFASDARGGEQEA